MFSRNEIFEYGISFIDGRNFKIRIIDFLAVCSNLSNEIKHKNRSMKYKLKIKKLIFFLIEFFEII
jgi:hypothetical protein